MMYVRVSHVSQVLPQALIHSKRPFIGMAWLGSHADSVENAVVVLRGRTFTETLYATEAAAQAIDKYAPSEAESYQGIAGDRIRFEARNQGIACSPGPL